MKINKIFWKFVPSSEKFSEMQDIEDGKIIITEDDERFAKELKPEILYS